MEDTESIELRQPRLSVFLALIAKRFWIPFVIALIVEITYVWARVKIPHSSRLVVDSVIGAFAVAFLMAVVFLIGKAWSDSAKDVYRGGTVPKTVISLSLIMFSAASLVAFAYTTLLKMKYPSLEQRGLFGDAFGALNALTSTVALIGLWATVLLQYRQIKDDRRRADEDRRNEERLKNEDRAEDRRKSWPAVVISKLTGTACLESVKQDGVSSFKFELEIEQRNCSDQVLINVVRNLQARRDVDDTCLINLFAEVERFLEAKSVLSTKAFFHENSFAGDDTTDALSGCSGRVVCVNILICTVQKSYYFISHQFKVRIADNPESKRILAAWIEVLSAIKGRVNKKVGKFDPALMLSQGLERARVPKGAKVDLEFVPLPSRYSFVEISESAYFAALDKKELPPIVRG